MRIARKFGKRTETPREPKRKFFLVFEGEKTEFLYFQGINYYKNDLNINSLIDIKPLMRSSGQEGVSNPKKIVEMLIKHMAETLDTGITCGSIIQRICDYLFYELEISESSLINTEIITEGLTRFSKKKFGYSPDTVVTDIRPLLSSFGQYLASKYAIENSPESMSQYIRNSDVIFDEDYDKVCIIVDRDRKSFTSEQYDYVLEQCRKYKFDLYVSNPCFEFWLLLHFPNAHKLDRKALLENRKITSKKTIAEKILAEKAEGYSKNALDFEIFKDKVDLAIEQEKLFCEDIAGLKNRLGSNVGLLITSMRV